MNMKFSTVVAPLEKQTNACIIVGIFENGLLSPSAEKCDRLTNGTIKKVLGRGGFKGKIGDALPLFQFASNQYQHILLVGCGPDKLLKEKNYHQLLLVAMRALTHFSTDTVITTLQELEVDQKDIAWKVRQTIACASEAFYRFDQFKQKKEVISEPKQFNFLCVDKKEAQIAEAAVTEGKAIADAVSFTKNLANSPSNICTPLFLAKQAKELSKNQKSLNVTVLDEKEMHKLGMGALLGVAKGSDEEAQFICLDYKGGGKKQRPVVFIGKGITFDTGGNSLKPADSMVGMKYDMCGAATVLGVMKATLALKLPINVVGLIPAVENMPGGTAYKPEDILTSLSGQTIEVLSTDAEGRLILADALTYSERYNPEVVIDIATLTGAIVIALGSHASGLFANNEQLANELLEAGCESYDRAWHMPLWDEYQDHIKSSFADIANLGGRSAGAVTAACFLSRFAKKFKWAHLDVAGTAANMAGTTDRYATGRPVPMLMQYLLNRIKG